MPSSVKPVHRFGQTVSAAFLVTLLAAGCSAPVRQPVAQPVPPPPPEPVIIQIPAPPLPAPPREALAPVLDTADRLRGLQGAELTQEITRLGEPATPPDQLRLAIALGQTRQLYDLVRAQELLQRLLADNSVDARPLHGLTRLLAARYAEQRRVEDQLDRQNQQVRDLQRRLDQTQDKLDALKEIERSLTSRPPAAPAAPAAPASAPNGRPRPAGS